MAQSWEQIYEGNVDVLVAYASQFGFTADSAEDIVHDAFLRVFRKNGETDHPNPRALLFQCVRWSALDRLKKSRRRRKREEDAAADLVIGLTSVDGPRAEDFAALVSRLLKKLPAEQREVLVLHLWGEMPFREIGEQLGISPNTAASRYRYALEKLRAEAGDADDFFLSRTISLTL